jgi:predicted nucleic acid-binding protein
VTLVVDSSALVSALVDDGPDGRWAEALLATEPLAAPHMMPAEVTNILRRAVLARELSEEVASMAHADLLQLPIDLFPYEPTAERVWELRGSLTTYDAWYVALAESLQAPLVTLDLRLTRAPGPRCAFATPSRHNRPTRPTPGK